MGFVVFALLFLSGEFDRLIIGQQLIGASGLQTATPALQMLGVAIYAVALALLFFKRLRASGPSIVLAIAANGLALVSAAWSPEPTLVIIRAFALAGAIPVAILLVAGLPEPDRVRVLRLFAYLFVISNLLAVAMPGGYGVHTAGENAVYDEHAGRWRGVFFHKNVLGEQTGIAVLVLTVLGRGLGGVARWFHRAMFVGAVVIVVFAGSAQLLAALPFAIAGAIFFTRFPRPRARLIATLVLATLAVALYAAGLFDLLLDVLARLVGRDATLSSRTEVWNAVISRSSAHSWFGQGYETAWTPDVAAAVRAAIGADVGHPHNGYLKVWMELGFVGLFVVVAVPLYSLTRAFRTPARTSGGYPAFCFSALIYALLINMANSDLMEYNSLLWVLVLAGAFSFDRAPQTPVRRRRRAPIGGRPQPVRI